MTNSTIQINVDAKEAIEAVNELTAAIERAHAALQKLTVSVEPNASESTKIFAGGLRADRIPVGTVISGATAYCPRP
jgi:glycine cleavage system regulatory protein